MINTMNRSKQNAVISAVMTELARRRWKTKTKKQRLAHIHMMNKARANKPTARAT